MVFEAPLAGLMEVPFEVSFVGWFEDPEFDPFEDLPVVPYDDQEKTVEIPTKKDVIWPVYFMLSLQIVCQTFKFIWD